VVGGWEVKLDVAATGVPVDSPSLIADFVVYSLRAGEVETSRKASSQGAGVRGGVVLGCGANFIRRVPVLFD
jgi:hypothetical protein